MRIKKIVLGGGCFWCTEAVFKMFDWTVSITPGYAGGTTKNPTYGEVCSGKTGHAEVAMLEYDSEKAGLDAVLEVFFAMHDPTSIDKQGNDTGSQYRSVILYLDEEDRKIVEEHIDRLQKETPKKIATQVRKLDVFYPAEDYHKDYYQNNKINPYCVFVIRPKLKKIMKEFGIKDN